MESPATVREDMDAPPDHRTVTARRKRDAMRARILSATMDLLADPAKVSVSIEDVARVAQISRGAFYKHFASLEEALAAIGQEATDGMTLHILPVYDVLTHPLERISTAMRLFLLRAHTDRRWAAFFLRAELVQHESILLKYVFADLEAGRGAGLLELPSMQAGVDALIGATLEGVRSMTQRKVDDPEVYIDAVILMVLRGFGVANTPAQEAVAFSKVYLQAGVASAAGDPASPPTDSP
ncbi:TetR/AcrR family transcriptional regulator [Pseudomonas sp. TH41]|nr:TetR/AcrR family transcriptional regulator [Pseudomonas sp. TH41]